MSVVYLAKAGDADAMVALKVIRSDADTPNALERFQEESAILQILDHDYVAKVYEAASTEEDWPYIVMEYVDGPPITTFCDEGRLGIEARLQLFRKVCAGVHAAHQKGVIHRDLKPSNVLVFEGERGPTPKIIDFGLARLLPWAERAHAGLTLGPQVLGTPGYVSPEQVTPGDRPPDIRSDVYSLGAILYELLIGEPPHQTEILARDGIEAMLRHIREDDPERPSVRVLRLAAGSEVPHRRGVRDVRALSRVLEGNLDWIPLKALDRDPERRYGSVSELSADVERHLNAELVSAGPPSLAHRLSRFVRQHRAVVAGTAAVVATLALGLVVSLILWRGSKRALDDLRRETLVRALYSADAAARARLESDPAWSLSLARLVFEKSLLSAPEIRVRSLQTLNRALQMSRSRLVLRHPSHVYGVDFSPDGSLLATGCADRSVRLWRLPQGALQAEWKLGQDSITGVRFDASGRFLATASPDRTVRVLEAATGRLVTAIESSEERFCDVAFSPDGSRLATGSLEGIVTLWNATTGKRVRRLPSGRQADWVCTVTFNPDGKMLASGGDDGIARVWDSADGRLLHELPPHGGPVWGVAFSADGSRFATASRDRLVRLWRVDDWTLERQLAGHLNGVTSLAFTPDGSRVISGSTEGTARVWDTSSGRAAFGLPGHEDEIWGVDISRDGRWLATASGDGTARIWDIERGRETEVLKEHSKPILAVSVANRGENLLGASGDGVVSRSQAFRAPSPITAVAIDPRGARFAAGLESGVLLVGSLSDLHSSLEIRAHNGPVVALSFSSDGRMLASSGHRVLTQARVVALWDATTGRKVGELSGHPDAVWSITFSEDGKRIATTSSHPTIRLWDASTLAFIKELKGGHQNRILASSFSPDGSLLASTGWDGAPVLWSLSDGQSHRLPRSHAGRTYDVRFTSNGAFIATSGDDGCVRFWDVRLRTEAFAVCGDGGVATRVALSPDDAQVSVGFGDGSIRLFDLSSERVLRMARERELNPMTRAECDAHALAADCAALGL